MDLDEVQVGTLARARVLIIEKARFPPESRITKGTGEPAIPVNFNAAAEIDVGGPHAGVNISEAAAGVLVIHRARYRRVVPRLRLPAIQIVRGQCHPATV